MELIGSCEFWNFALERLGDAGYRPTRGSSSGDLVLYGFRHSSGIVAKHIGLLQTGGEIQSKFEAGHVFQHAPEIVPSEYGDSLLFLSRSP